MKLNDLHNFQMLLGSNKYCEGCGQRVCICDEHDALYELMQEELDVEEN